MRAAKKKPPALPPLDENGLLCNPQQWNDTIAQLLADYHEVGTLTTDHWQVISTLRAHYARFGAAPAMIQVCRLHGKDRNWVHNLFHSCLNAWRVAGLPDPGEEAKSYMSGN